MNKRKARLMRIFDDSDSSTEADPYQDDDGDYGSDKKSSKTTTKGQSNLASTSTQKPVTSDPSSDEDDTKSGGSDHTLRTVNIPSPQTPTLSRFQEEGYDSNSSEEIFPLAKRLKLVKSPITTVPTVNPSLNEVTQLKPETTASSQYVASFTNLDNQASHNISQNEVWFVDFITNF
ncbi:hypothetical protein PYW08_006259 [Mythimna loreyi]|uniref:Uncharacterized protein n=1 Tax=Mythimna loreyi TaxID=667449 RepID=A0ACC2QPQ7_9NEOP|nr:hypothetical protein PYW08_006259 [Mythimna loreyi]